MTRFACSLLFIAGCRACTTTTGETEYEKIEAPLRVAVVREASPTTMGFANVGFVLRVGLSPSFDEMLDYCMVSKYGIGEDATGKLVAFRCAMDGEPWKLLRVTAGAHVRDCSTDLGVERKPDFTKAKPIADVAVPILECHEGGHGTTARPYAEVYTAIAAQLRESGGSGAVATFFAKTSDRARPPMAEDDEDPWNAAVTALSATEQASIDADLCPALLDATKTHAYVRAARRCPLRDPAVVAAALARVRADLAAPDPKATGKWPQPLAWALPIAANGDPKATHSLACAFAKTAPDDDFRRNLVTDACPSLATCDARTWDLEARTDAGVRVTAPHLCR